MNFNDYKNEYGEIINSALKFSGKEQDFFISIKANYLQEIIKRINHPNKLSVLDVGCGHGLIHPYLKSLNIDLVGVDVADEVLQLAKEKNPDVAYQSYDGKKLPFEDNSIDFAFTICVMHHVLPDQWPAFLTEIKRVLKVGGMLVIFEHNPYNPLTRYIVANNVLDEDAVLLSDYKLKKLMRQAGFSKGKTRHILFTPFKHIFFQKLDKFLSWCPLGAQYYAAGFKQ